MHLSGARVWISLLAVLLLAYGVDAWRARHNPTGDITVLYMWQLPLKNGKIEYDYDHSGTETCVNAWLPHAGRRPCWYLQRHRMQTICCQ